jgi:hypothetical protein
MAYLDLEDTFTVEPCTSGFLVRQSAPDENGDPTDEDNVFAFSSFDDVLRFLAGASGYDGNCWPGDAQ